MSQARFDAMVQAAQAEGLLPAKLEPLQIDSRPWPVVLLTALGAWLAAVPFFIFMGVLFGAALRESAGAGLIGLLLMGAAIVVLRQRSLSPFLEQLAIPCLITGLVLFGWMLADKLDGQFGASVLLFVMLIMAAMIEQAWLRVLFGAAAAYMGGIVMMGELSWFGSKFMASFSPWQTLHILTAVGLMTVTLSLKRFAAGAKAQWVAKAETTLAGWLLASLAGLAAWSGMTFLSGASLGGTVASHLFKPAIHEFSWWHQCVSALLGLSGGAWLIMGWPSLRQAWCGGVVLVLTALCALMPTLGACLLVLALCLGTRRWLLAAAAALAAAWILGAFYYALSWPLATKGISLMMAGVVLAGLAFWGFRSQRLTPPHASPGPPSRVVPVLGRRVTWGIALSVGLILLSANVGIWQKERLIRHGRAVFVPLLPVDPRSLMQGDFMTLNFMPRTNDNMPELNMDQEAFTFEHQRMIFKLDAQGVASMPGPDRGQALAQDEVAMELVPKNGRWILVTDAFYFKEGEGERWALARFGEFRVDASGKALLVGLRGEGLKPL